MSLNQAESRAGTPDGPAGVPASAATPALDAAAPTRHARARALARGFATPATAALAASLWLLGLHPVLPAQMGSLGLIAQLSPVQLASYPILVAAMVAEVAAARPRPRLLAAFTALGVLLVYGLQPASEQAARMSVAWTHAGFAQYIAVHGHVLNGFDARFSWPGFFSLIAFIARASGRTDATGLLRWAPMVLAGLGTLGMRALATQVLGTGRAAWIATWLFLFAEWTEQDYFSPQAVTYVLMLAGLAVTLRYLVRSKGDSPRTMASRGGLGGSSPRASTAAQAIVVVIALALAPSHQLTPFVFGGLLLIMLFTRRLCAPWLPWLVLAPAVLWFGLGATDFWQGHLNTIFGDIGNVSSSVHQGIGARFVGDAGRTFLLGLRVGLTAAMGLLALTGWGVLRRRGTRSWTLPLLAAAPFTLVALQSYGGEIFLRCYLFALPFAAILAAVAVDALIGTGHALAGGSGGVVPPGKHGSRLRPRGALLRRAMPLAAAFAILTGLGLATVTARGGNDAYTSISRADVAAMDYTYLHATPGQSIAALLSDVPLSYRNVGSVTQRFFDSCPEMTDMARCVLDAPPDYLLITPSQDNHGRIYYGLRPGWTNQVVRRLLASGRYRQVFDEAGSRVLARQPRAGVPVPAGS